MQNIYKTKVGIVAVRLSGSYDSIQITDGRLPDGLINSNGLIEGETKEFGIFPLEVTADKEVFYIDLIVERY